MKKEINSYKKIFRGIVKKIAKPVATIELERTVYHPKYERFLKTKTKIRARISKKLIEKIKLDDYVIVKECRPLSKNVRHIIK